MMRQISVRRYVEVEIDHVAQPGEVHSLERLAVPDSVVGVMVDPAVLPGQGVKSHVATNRFIAKN